MKKVMSYLLIFITGTQIIIAGEFSEEYLFNKYIEAVEMLNEPQKKDEFLNAKNALMKSINSNKQIVASFILKYDFCAGKDRLLGEMARYLLLNSDKNSREAFLHKLIFSPKYNTRLHLSYYIINPFDDLSQADLEMSEFMMNVCDKSNVPEESRQAIYEYFSIMPFEFSENSKLKKWIDEKINGKIDDVDLFCANEIFVKKSVWNKNLVAYIKKNLKDGNIRDAVKSGILAGLGHRDLSNVPAVDLASITNFIIGNVKMLYRITYKPICLYTNDYFDTPIQHLVLMLFHDVNDQTLVNKLAQIYIENCSFQNLFHFLCSDVDEERIEKCYEMFFEKIGPKINDKSGQNMEWSAVDIRLITSALTRYFASEKVKPQDKERNMKIIEKCFGLTPTVSELNN